MANFEKIKNHKMKNKLVFQIASKIVEKVPQIEAVVIIINHFFPYLC